MGEYAWTVQECAAAEARVRTQKAEKAAEAWRKHWNAVVRESELRGRNKSRCPACGRLIADYWREKHLELDCARFQQENK